MVSVRKRGKVYEYRFETGMVDGKRKWITKSGYSSKSEAFKEGAKAYNEFYYNGNKVQLKENMSYSDFLDYWIDNYANFNLHYSTTISYINIIKKNELSENETNLLKNIGIKIEDRNYNQDEVKLIENDIIDDIFRRSSKNGDIQKANEQYSNIIEKLEKVKG